MSTSGTETSPSNALDRPSTDVKTAADLIRPMIDGKRVLVVAGATYGSDYAANVGSYAQALGAPLFADPQCRPDTTVTIGAADVLASEGMLDSLVPDVILRLGGIPDIKVSLDLARGERDTPDPGEPIAIDRSPRIRRNRFRHFGCQVCVTTAGLPR